MFNKARKIGLDSWLQKPPLLGTIIDSYRRHRSERLAEAVLNDYFFGQLFEDQSVEIVHSETAKQNCRGLRCQSLQGTVVGKPYLSDSKRTLLVDIERPNKKHTSLGLMTRDDAGWRSTGWEIIKNSEEEC